MNILKKIPFTHNGKDYDIVVFSDSNTITVKAYFNNGEAANGFSHSINFQVAFDMKRTKGWEPMDILIEDTKRDIVEERWKKILKLWTDQQQAKDKQ